jgi:hypothetical protein
MLVTRIPRWQRTWERAQDLAWCLAADVRNMYLPRLRRRIFGRRA